MSIIVIIIVLQDLFTFAPNSFSRPSVKNAKNTPGTFSRLARSRAAIYIFARVRIFSTLMPFMQQGIPRHFLLHKKTADPHINRYGPAVFLIYFYLFFLPLVRKQWCGKVSVSGIRKQCHDRLSCIFRSLRKFDRCPDRRTRGNSHEDSFLLSN